MRFNRGSYQTQNNGLNIWIIWISFLKAFYTLRRRFRSWTWYEFLFCDWRGSIRLFVKWPRSTCEDDIYKLSVEVQLILYRLIEHGANIPDGIGFTKSLYNGEDKNVLSSSLFWRFQCRNKHFVFLLTVTRSFLTNSIDSWKQE